jgi:hypothetical protein
VLAWFFESQLVAVMPESDGNTKNLSIACYVCLFECVLAAELHGVSLWIDWLLRSECELII